jgi:colanic acid biosynthesis glycosyl transferase WcaI
VRITFIVAVFPPEGEPSAVMAAELARWWVQAGHEVSVICPFPSRPRGVVHPGFRRRLRTESIEVGVRVVRVWTWLIGQRRRAVNRILENTTFGISSALALLFSRKPDVVLLESWPILAQLPVLFVAKVRGMRIINYVKDLYPEAAVAANLVKEHGALDQLLLRTDAFVFRRSNHNVVISDSVRDWVVRTRQVPHSKISVVRDWLDLEEIRPFEGVSSWREEVGIPSKCKVFMYAGTMGHASGVKILSEVAKRLVDVEDIRIVCIGEGVLKSELESDKAAHDLKNLLLLPFQPRARLAEVQSCADVMLMLTSRKLGVSSVPSKLITYLAVGKPILCATDENSDMAGLIRENDLGVVVTAESVQAIVDGLQWMRSLPAHELTAMGRRAREYAMEHYSSRRAFSQFQNLISA